ncbi:MAG TPA: iron-sulfur cluster insertion protein ErpA [Acidimicrobiales bacterium]|nr:iron-sulfur cluster insertion protein ErpA [Acidimicrobiales bacterium]
MSTQVSIGGVRTKAPDSIVLTDAAVAKVGELLAAEDDKNLVLRVAVRPGGCSGFSYEMFFDTDVADDDHIDDYKGVKVAVDAASKAHLKGATLEYKDALQGGGFSINNPNAERTCGCGQSFS